MTVARGKFDYDPICCFIAEVRDPTHCNYYYMGRDYLSLIMIADTVLFRGGEGNSVIDHGYGFTRQDWLMSKYGSFSEKEDFRVGFLCRHLEYISPKYLPATGATYCLACRYPLKGHMARFFGCHRAHIFHEQCLLKSLFAPSKDQRSEHCLYGCPLFDPRTYHDVAFAYHKQELRQDGTAAGMVPPESVFPYSAEYPDYSSF